MRSEPPPSWPPPNTWWETFAARWRLERFARARGSAPVYPAGHEPAPEERRDHHPRANAKR